MSLPTSIPIRGKHKLQCIASRTLFLVNSQIPRTQNEVWEKLYSPDQHGAKLPTFRTVRTFPRSARPLSPASNLYNYHANTSDQNLAKKAWSQEFFIGQPIRSYLPILNVISLPSAYLATLLQSFSLHSPSCHQFAPPPPVMVPPYPRRSYHACW